MPCHISGQNHTDASLAEGFELVARKLRHEVEFLFIYDREGLSNVVILLDALIVVSDSSLTDGIDVVCVVKTIVGKVVADTPN